MQHICFENLMECAAVSWKCLLKGAILASQIFMNSLNLAQSSATPFAKKSSQLVFTKDKSVVLALVFRNVLINF